jgi:hypothetical protein
MNETIPNPDNAPLARMEAKDVSVYIDKPTRLRLKAFAAEQGISVNEAVQRIIAQEVERLCAPKHDIPLIGIAGYYQCPLCSNLYKARNSMGRPLKRWAERHLRRVHGYTDNEATAAMDVGRQQLIEEREEGAKTG